MLPGAHQGNSNQSELFKSMKAYLNSTNRLQPFIGLSSIIECVNGGTDQRDAFYLCEVCVCRLDKADMRNHIMGGLHRYNYIKTRHPDLVSDWREVSSLTKLAWPLMDIAKKIEEKEGPGNVQVVEFDKSSYQQMESQSNAKIVISFLRHILKDSEPESSASLTSNSPSNRIVLYSPRKKLEKSSKKEVYILPQDSLTQQASKVSESSKDLLTDTSRSSFLSGCTEPVPFIGLSRVVECKSEDGQTYCFLCHCCRVRSHKHDIIDHLTSTSHITNYLMETHPEQLQSLDMNDNYQLESLVQNLKQEENTKEIKVVQLPESLCVQMTGKSYHWCVKTLAWNNSDFPVKYVQVKRQKLHQKPHHRGPKKSKKAVQIKQDKKKKKVRRSKHKDNPVFRVMLPVTQGSLLVERTAFSKDDPPLPLSYSPSPPECSPSPSDEPQYSQDAQDYKLDWPREILDNTPPEDTSLPLDSQYQPTDFFPANENIKQERDYQNEENNGQWVNQDQSADCKTDMDLNVAMWAKNYKVKNGFGPPPPPQYSNEYWPHSFSSQESGIEKQGCPINNPVGNPYYQPSSYMPPDYTNQQHVYSSRHFSGGPFSQNNNMNSLTDRTQASYYTECGGNMQQYSSSYQVSSSGSWGTYQSHASGQCYGPCCVPPPPPSLPPPSFSGAGFLGGISGNYYESAPSNSMCYPMPDFYPSQGCPY